MNNARRSSWMRGIRSLKYSVHLSVTVTSGNEPTSRPRHGRLVVSSKEKKLPKSKASRRDNRFTDTPHLPTIGGRSPPMIFENIGDDKTSLPGHALCLAARLFTVHRLEATRLLYRSLIMTRRWGKALRVTSSYQQSRRNYNWLLSFAETIHHLVFRQKSIG